MSKNSYESGKSQAESDVKTGNVSESLQTDSPLDGSLGASREYKDGYREGIKESQKD